MEVREFAEQVLFATSLEEKLSRPSDFTDEQPGSIVLAPPSPGRPADLRFKLENTGPSDFPPLQSLGTDRARGKLLHFFANHELLATELMALVLLRFPNAPPEFRRGVLRTLQDEQDHTRLYLERMRECGVAFGELPVSGYFWRCVSGMENPIDYVAGLCLTFEQANLDFCQHFAAGFQQAGDSTTAGLLQKIYRDEIAHVAYGLKWFRRWKNPDESDWAAFCKQLKFPLSPQRAKGPKLNVLGREAAGFDRQFISELNIYSQSRGRTPGVFVFNPLTEGSIAYGRAFSPKRHQALLAQDLENLPQFLCRQDDIVLVHRRPSLDFLTSLKSAGFTLPEFIELTAQQIAPDAPVRGRKLGALRPWGWGPDSVRLLTPLFENVTGKVRQPKDYFNENIAQLYSKEWSAELLRKFLRSRSKETWLCGETDAGVRVSTMPEALEQIRAIRERGHHRIVVKQSVGLAGHNSLRLFELDLLDSQRRWIEHLLKSGQPLVVEPWLARELDFSVQLEMEGAGLKLVGFTGLLNDLKGQFLGNWAEPNFARRPPAAVLRSFARLSQPAAELETVYTALFEHLERELRQAEFRGPVGIDALVYRTAQGTCRLKPVVEINPRYTMGRLLLELMAQVAQGSFGVFRLRRLHELGGHGFGDAIAYAESSRRAHPLALQGEPKARIRSGFLCLNDPECAQAVLSELRVFRGRAELTAFLEREFPA